jgi:hypothetical protein
MDVNLHPIEEDTLHIRGWCFICATAATTTTRYSAGSGGPRAVEF